MGPSFILIQVQVRIGWKGKFHSKFQHVSSLQDTNVEHQMFSDVLNQNFVTNFIIFQKMPLDRAKTKLLPLKSWTLKSCRTAHPGLGRGIFLIAPHTSSSLQDRWLSRADKCSQSAAQIFFLKTRKNVLFVLAPISGGSR